MNDLKLQEFYEASDETVIVLIVDDQPMIVEAVRRQLASEIDLKFHYCTDSTQAVIEAVRVKPTVILQDMVMPGLDGLSLIQEYRKNVPTRGIPIIALSVKEDPSVKSRAFEAGADDYLVKLPDPIELIARIRYHSRSFVTARRLDHTYRALRTSQQQLLDTNLTLQRAMGELKRLVNSDGLTEIANRRHFDEFLQAEWQTASRAGLEISLLMVDVDFFKRFNDSFGHLAGDDTLKKVAGAMRDAVEGESFLPARYGGEEFAVILPATSSVDAMTIAENLRKKVEALKIPHNSPEPTSVITVSIGIATMSPERTEDCKMLIDLADKGLYLAKRGGRNRVGVCPADGE
ncbi:diguanylate cyclase [Pseudomonas hormoni]|uniref:diguanylate cyclase n=1 Tax=Pseudomonas hormoni TaxID=3093767 RepID=A0ABX8EQD4_9PSED|nr:diguanylate cyclase [Pseudomonas hormoni]QVW21856.1 diguanylate cyclase [Pseudomonas hormoni]